MMEIGWAEVNSLVGTMAQKKAARLVEMRAETMVEPKANIGEKHREK